MASTVRSRFNHYEALGVAPTAAGDEIARAFAKQGSVLRPHAFGGLAEVCFAYETLRDPIKRRAYDASLGLEREPKPRNLPPAPLDEPPVTSNSLERAAINTVLPPAPVINSHLPHRRGADPMLTPEPRIIRGDLPGLALAKDLGVELRPIDWRRTGIALGAVVVAASLLGGLAGWWSVREVDEPPQSANAVSVSLPPAKPLATLVVPQTAPPPAPVRSVLNDRLDRAKPVVAAATPVVTPVVSEPTEAEEMTQEGLAESRPDPSASGQAADEAPTIPTVAAAMPLPNRVVARTIERIGYACGRVVTTSPVEGEAAGVYKVDCSSGQSYQARPVNGRYHFRRWGRR